jgi:hypothetical protein
MRLPRGRAWGSHLRALHLSQVVSPCWALAAVSSLTAAFLGRVPRPDDRAVILGLGYAIFLGAVAVTVLGGRARKTVEWAEWLLMAWTLLFLAVLAYLLVPRNVWRAVATGFVVPSLPVDRDVRNWVLLAAFAAYSGPGTINAALTQWLRDKGLAWWHGEGQAVGLGNRSSASHATRDLRAHRANLDKWRQWWRYLGMDFHICGRSAVCFHGPCPSSSPHTSRSREGVVGFGAPTWLPGHRRRSGLVLWTLALLTGVAVLAPPRWNCRGLREA